MSKAFIQTEQRGLDNKEPDQIEHKDGGEDLRADNVEAEGAEELKDEAKTTTMSVQDLSFTISRATNNHWDQSRRW